MDIARMLKGDGSDAPVHRRTFAKTDGRMLHLYGRSPHTLDPPAETADAIATGAQMRFQPLRGEWNIYAAHRQHRTSKPIAAEDTLAPSRPGHPATEIPFADFEIAVFDNKFAALQAAAPAFPPMPGIAAEPARGACEVVVYTAASSGSLHTIGQDRRRLLVSTWIDRMQSLFGQGCAYALPFENRGPEAGATLHHPHGQIYGFKKAPQVARLEAQAFADGYDLAAEIAESLPDHGIAHENRMAAFCPRPLPFPTPDRRWRWTPERWITERSPSPQVTTSSSFTAGMSARWRMGATPRAKCNTTR